ncbi:F-box domain containing protein [Pleurostoma richardsiae]|uniref:F-box domain containing protein n=1 Tax=Pleurostoma richardsiae TaxID=41990 RepID=A0AA38S4K1_9PEZI|nr:F-box domain containing protein [Pleurostoma richardsiae]
MIETLYMSQGPAYMQQGTPTESPLSPKGFMPTSPRQEFTRDEHMLMVQELNRMRGSSRTPRRSHTTHEHLHPRPPTLTVSSPRPQPQGVVPEAASPSPTASEASETSSATSSLEPAQPAVPQQERPIPRRPKLGPPRRSYSVMDYEPVPPEQRPSPSLTLEELPGEIHYAIFDFLDPIDSTCLGLTNKHFYDIHRRMYGSIPLSARRDGPNELEWAWHLAGPLWSPRPSTPGATTNTLGGDKNNLAALRVPGKGLCRKCGVSRCELHKHIQTWMPENYEYCSVRSKFVPRPGEEAKSYCYLSSPKDSHRCGRHRVKKSKPAPQ